MSIFEYDEERERELIKKAEFESGKEEGIKAGIELGKAQGIELGKAQGIELGKIQGIAALIHAFRDLGASREAALLSLKSSFPSLKRRLKGSWNNSGLWHSRAVKGIFLLRGPGSFLRLADGYERSSQPDSGGLNQKTRPNQSRKGIFRYLLIGTRKISFLLYAVSLQLLQLLVVFCRPYMLILAIRRHI